jgi:hypothetical protein
VRAGVVQHHVVVARRPACKTSQAGDCCEDRVSRSREFALARCCRARRARGRCGTLEARSRRVPVTLSQERRKFPRQDRIASERSRHAGRCGGADADYKRKGWNDGESYAGFWVMRRSGGAICRHFDDLDAVLESDTSDDFRQLICSIQAPPSF